MITDKDGNEITPEELNNSMEDLSPVYDKLYDENGKYIGPKKYLPEEEYIPGRPDPSEFIEHKKDFEITPANLRAHFLKRAAPLIDEYIEGAFGRKAVNGDKIARFEVWSMLKEIIMTAKNPAPLMDIKGKSIDEQVNQILTFVSEGKITLDEGKEYLSLVQQGFELTELPKLMSQMEKLETLGVL